MLGLKTMQDFIQKLIDGNNLTFEESKIAMNHIMEGSSTEAQFGAFVTSLRIKGETVDEVAGMASVMREKSLKVNVDGILLDTCGTGGDGKNTFNISTGAAFVVAGSGVKVAKHGNRAMSGSSGSADVLEKLGANINLSPKSVERLINDAGFGFMFAQVFHPSMKFAAGPRREIGIRTVFNILGPLTNPAGATNQLIGVSDSTVGELMASVLAKLGVARALVVHGDDGLDEVTIATTSTAWLLESGKVSEFSINPEDLGVSLGDLDLIRADDPIQSTNMIENVLKGDRGPARDIVLLNAAAALYAAGVEPDIEHGIRSAEFSIDSGKAIGKLKEFVGLSQELE
ncbi:MAG: anthranilate phosphoribosyltransferase [Dehalococcoidia bacterium]